MTRKMLSTLLVVGVLGTLAGIGTFAAFSSTTANAGNAFQAGTVHVTDNDADALLYNVSNAKPGTSESKCIKLTYGGSLDSAVHMYASTVASVGQYVNFTLTRGTGSVAFPSCTGATFEATPLYNGTLKGFADTYNSYDSGLDVKPSSSATKWTGDAAEAIVLKFDVSMQDINSSNGSGSGRQTTGAHTFTWQARNI